MIYNARVAGSAALHLLRTERDLTVHSVFKNGMNLVNRNGDLCFIGTDKNGYFPFGLTLNQKSVHEILSVTKVKDKITIYRQELRHKNYSIMLNQVEELRPDYDFVNADINTLIKNFKSIDFSVYKNSDFTHEKVQSLLLSLETYDKNLEQNLRYFIGRGNGLTPSGDDIITGILYGDALVPFIDDRSYGLIERLYSEDLTTMVSQNFVRLALNEIFSSRITDLHQNPSVETMQKLIELGSSSGLDTLYGISETLKQE